MEAQRKAVEDYLNGGRWKLVKEFVEVESGKYTDRKVLAQALQACRVYGAKLVIAKLDRLSRDAHFLLGLEKAGVDFVAADMPTANRLTVGVMAMVAEEEGRAISRRTKEALAAAKRRGVKLGNYCKNPMITPEARKAGVEALQRAAADRAKRPSSGYRRATGKRRSVTAGHRSGAKQPQHPHGQRRHMVGNAGDARIVAAAIGRGTLVGTCGELNDVVSLSKT